MYSGTGNLVLIASPLSEIAYQMIVAPGDVSKSSPICEIALKIRPNRPALSFCAAVLVRSVGEKTQ
jgi:hypothetical protein